MPQYRARGSNLSDSQYYLRGRYGGRRAPNYPAGIARGNTSCARRFAAISQ